MNSTPTTDLQGILGRIIWCLQWLIDNDSKTNCGRIYSSKLSDNVETFQMSNMTKQPQPELTMFFTINTHLSLPLERKL